MSIVSPNLPPDREDPMNEAPPLPGASATREAPPTLEDLPDDCVRNILAMVLGVEPGEVRRTPPSPTNCTVVSLAYVENTFLTFLLPTTPITSPFPPLLLRPALQR
jgi:hypothetical protein